MVTWEDRLLESEVRFGGLVLWVDEGAEGWRLHLSHRPFVIAPKGATRDEAKREAEKAIAAIVGAAVAAEREACAKVAEGFDVIGEQRPAVAYEIAVAIRSRR